MKKSILVICFLLLALASHIVVNAQQLSNKQEKFYQEEILKYINGYRSKKNLNALILDDNLNRIAYGHSQGMSVGQVSFGHDGFNDRLAKAKQYNTKLSSFAENVAYGMQSPKEVSKDWYGSSGHRKNLLGNFVRTGIGVERGEDGYLYFTQIFEK